MGVCSVWNGERGERKSSRTASRSPGTAAQRIGGKWRAVSSGRPPALRGAFISGARASCQLWEEAVMQCEVRKDSLAGEVVPDL